MEVNGVPWLPVPWLPYLATDYIRRIMPRSVFEWGTGGSTIFFKDMSCELISVEHNSEWHAATLKELTERGYLDNSKYNLIPYELGEIGPDYSDPAHYKSYCTEFPKHNLKKYVEFIDGQSVFDLILIDGYARASCIAHAVNHVVSGGWIVIDNTDRDWYLKNTLHLFEGWERIDIKGYGPILEYQWQTTLFRDARKEHYAIDM